MALESTQPLTEMNTRNIFSGLKGASVYSSQMYHHNVPIVLKSGSLKFLQNLEHVQGSTGIASHLNYPVSFMTLLYPVIFMTVPYPVQFMTVHYSVPLMTVPYPVSFMTVTYPVNL
jgi:hypothetical protein